MTSLSRTRPLFLDEAEIETQVEFLLLLCLVLKEDFDCFVALTLDLLWADVPRWDELKGLKVPEVLLVMFLWIEKSRVSDVPKIFFD